MSDFGKHVLKMLVLDPEAKSGIRWGSNAPNYVSGKDAGTEHSRYGRFVRILGEAYRCADIVSLIMAGGVGDVEPINMKIRAKSRSGLKGVKIIKKAKNGGVTGYLPRIKRKDFSWTGDIQTDKRVAAAMVDDKLIEIDGDKAITNKSLGLI